MSLSEIAGLLEELDDVDLDDFTVLQATPTQVQLREDDDVLTLTGNFGFGPGAGGLPTTGTISSIRLVDDEGDVEFARSGLDIEIPDFFDAIDDDDDRGGGGGSNNGGPSGNGSGSSSGNNSGGNNNGDDGADNLRGNGGDNTLLGRDGNDQIRGGGGNDRLSGGDENDRLFGQGGNDVLFGGDDNDRLNGGNGNDRLFGGDENDVLRGGNGNDVLVGGEDGDILFGGSGADRFVFREGDYDDLDSEPGDRDIIRDFESGLDILDLRQIDANENTGAGDAFDYIGGAGFSGTAGELRLSSNNVLLGDTDGDGRADFSLRVQGDTVEDSDILF